MHCRYIRGLSLTLCLLLLLSYSGNVLGQGGQTKGSLTLDAVVIYSVSTVNAALNSAPYGSVYGGQNIYLQVSNIDPTASNNQVFIGPYPCIIPDKGVNSVFLMCQTTTASDPNQWYNQPVVVYVTGKQESTCAPTISCTFTFSLSYTPQLTYVTPFIVTPGNWTNWGAVFLVSNTVDILNYYIDICNCGRFDLELDEQDPLSPTTFTEINTRTAIGQTAGYYLVTLNTTTGSQRNEYSMLHYHTYDLKSFYHFTVKPEIYQVSSNEASLLGNQLTVLGDGFGIDPRVVTVKAGGLPCAVSSISTYQLTCTVAPGATANTSNVGPQGVFVSVYNNVGVNALRSQAVKNDNSQAAHFNTSYTIGTFEIIDDTNYMGYWLRGFFKVPTSGIYNFVTTGDDNVLVYFNQVPGSTNLTQQILVGQVCSWTEWRDQYSNPSPCDMIRSQDLNLTAGDYHYVEAYWYQGTGSGHFTLSLEAPNPQGFNATPPAIGIFDVQSVSINYTQIPEQWDLRVWGTNNTFQVQFQYVVGLTVQYTGVTELFTYINCTPSVLASQLNSATGNYNAQVLAYDLDQNGQVINYCPVMNDTRCGLGCTSCNLDRLNGLPPVCLSCAANYTLNNQNQCSLFNNSSNGNQTVYGNGSQQQNANCVPFNLAASVQQGRQWIVSFANYRDQVQYQQPPTIIGNPTASQCSVAKLQTPYPPVSGTYQLSWQFEDGSQLPISVWTNNAWTTNIPFNCDASCLASGIGQLFRAYDLEGITNGMPSDGYNNTIVFISDNPQLKGSLNPIVVFDDSGLSGGQAGTSPSVTVTKLRNGSNRPFYEPIPDETVYLVSSTPQTIVTVNKIDSLCSTNCAYYTTAAATAVVNSFSLSGNTLMLSISGSRLGSTPTLVINYAGSLCGNVSVQSLTAVTCKLPTDNSGNVLLEAGAQIPSVLHVGYGYANTSSLSPVTYTLTVSAVSPASCGVNGGVPITITGTKFPLSYASGNEQLNVTIAGVPVLQIVSVNSTQIVVITPPAVNLEAASSLNIVVSFNSQSVTLSSSFAYTTDGVPDVTSVSPTSSNPQLKTFIIITGTNFGTDVNAVQVFLDLNATKVQTYQLHVDSVNSTTIVAFLGGGATGDYLVRVWVPVLGSSIHSIPFSYAFTVDSVSPSSGSLNGGTVVTLFGSNFLTTSGDNSVFLFDSTAPVGQQYIECTVISQNLTQIQFLTAAYNPQTLQVILQAKLADVNLCPSNACTFTFSQALTPNLTGITYFAAPQYWYAGNQITLSGQGFSAGSGVTIYLSADLSLFVVATIQSDTSIQFTIPATIPASDLQALVYVANLGYAGFIIGSNAYNYLNVRIPLHVQSYSPSNGSQFGQIFEIYGSGFGQNLTNIPVYLSSQQCLLSWLSPVQIVANCLQPKALTSGSTYNLTIYRDLTFDIPTSVTLSYLALSTSTPTITSTSPSLKTQIFSTSPFQVTLAGNLLSSGIVASLSVNGFTQSVAMGMSQQVMYTPTQFIYNASAVSNLQVTFTGIPAGNYALNVYVPGYGFADASSYPFIIALRQVAGVSTTTSFAGGVPLQITGYNFDLVNYGNNRITVCGFQCPITQAGTLQSGAEFLQCVTPSINSRLLSSYYQISESPVQIDPSLYTIFSSNPATQNYINDGYWQTVFSSSGPTCYIGYNFGPELAVQITQISFTINILETSLSQYYGAQFQGSTDGNTWTTIYTIDNTIRLNLNLVKITDTGVDYQYVRLFNQVASGSADCGFAEIDIWGYTSTQTNPNDLSAPYYCPVNLTINGQSAQVASIAEYLHSMTPTITAVSPTYGWQLGGFNVTFTGTLFGSDPTKVSVQIDGIPCAIISVTQTTIFCTAGSKGPTNFSPPQLNITVNGSLALPADGVAFYYGLLWSNILSWSGDGFPVAGDTVYVPSGVVLIVDQSTPVALYLIEVEGTILFADNQDLTVDTNMLLVYEGKLQAGTETAPYQHKLTITLYGSQFDAQLPDLGNKFVGCQHCILDLHGSPKIPTWTFLSTTIPVGATTLTLTQPVNWLVGDTIVIASTDYDHRHSENVTIVSIDSTMKILTFSPPLQYQHYAGDEPYGGVTLHAHAEVGVITRNILIRGNPDDSLTTQYGGHLIIHGGSGASSMAGMGSVARIQQIELTLVGQPIILGRYAIHFHMNGDCSQSYAIGCAVHDSFARVVVLHAVQYLHVAWNVGFRASGHNIFLEDGIEQNNLIEYNLIVSTQSATNMLQTDITCASYWITNPTNFVQFNHAAGSDFYGFWYEIKAIPTGPSATSLVCPIGMPLGLFDSNVAHSNVRFGLRFFNYAPCTYPCKPTRNPFASDQFADNPSLQQKYTNFTTFKNGQNGILAENLGYAVFQDFIVADSYNSAIEMYVANATKQGVLVNNWTIIGRSGINPSEVPVLNSFAFITPRSDGFTANNVKIYNFDNNMTIINGPSKNDIMKTWVQGGKQSNYGNITIDNSASTAAIVQWLGQPHNLIFDIDGSLTGTRVPTWITPYKPVFNITGCTRHSESAYQDSVLCSVPIRSFAFRAIEPLAQFVALDIRWVNLETLGYPLGTNETLTPYQYGDSSMMKIENLAADDSMAFVALFAAGYVYNVQWNTGIDWTHVLIAPSDYYAPTDPPIILRFNNSQDREKIDIYSMVGGSDQYKYRNVSKYSLVNPDNITVANGVPSCLFGDNYYDPFGKELLVCISPNNRSNIYENLDLNAFYCDLTCPTLSDFCVRDGTPVYWSDESVWSGQALRKSPSATLYSSGTPQPGDDVNIPCPLTLVIDQDINVGTLTIYGAVSVDCTKDITITATNIWIRSGTFTAGSAGTPCAAKITFSFIGSPESPQVVLDNTLPPASKTIVVTGSLQLYGVAPPHPSARLGKTVLPGQTSLLIDGDLTGWHPGDQIILAPTENNANEFEEFNISSISGQTIQLSKPVQYLHYGSLNVSASPIPGHGFVKIDPSLGGELDMRAGVGHVTRNIKITSTNDGSWGGSVQIYHWYLIDPSTKVLTPLLGSATLSGVEFFNGGKANSPVGGVQILNTASFTQAQIVSNDPDYLASITTISNCGFHDSVGSAIVALNVTGVIITNNVIYNQERFGISILQYNQVSIIQNLIVGTRTRAMPVTGTSLWDPVCGIYAYTGYNALTDNVVIQHNVAQGVESGINFAFPGVNCSQQSAYAISNNTGGTASVGVLYNMPLNICYYAGGASVYHATKGIIVNPSFQQFGYLIEKLRISECITNFVLRSGTQDYYLMSTQFVNSWLASAARPDCAACYQADTSTCTGTSAVSMQITNQGGEQFPLDTTPLGYDVVCTPTSTFHSSFLNNVHFYNYKQTYLEPAFVNCSTNSVFRNHGTAHDSSAGQYLTNTTCNNCDYASLFKIATADPTLLGWFGGCGVIQCTGLFNIISFDTDGVFFSSVNGGAAVPSTFISNNIQIGPSLPGCSFVSTWNGYRCNYVNLGVLEWEARGSDADQLSNQINTVDNGIFSNIVNMYREWEWIGNEPQNERLNRFVSLIQINSTYNITYQGTNPSDLWHRLQHRTLVGEPGNFVVVRYQYGVPLTIQVQVNGTVIPPAPFTAPLDFTNLSNIACGANNYFYQNRTIHFSVTGDIHCLVEVILINSVQVNLMLAVTSEDFWNDNTQTQFINRISAFLSIPVNRIKIVGIAKVPTRRRNLQYSASELELTFTQIEEEEISADMQLELRKLQAAVSQSVTIQITSGVSPSQANYSQTAAQNDYLALTAVGSQLASAINKGSISMSDIGVTLQSATYSVGVGMPASIANSTDRVFTNSDIVYNNTGQVTASVQSSSNNHMLLGILLGTLLGSLAFGLAIFFGYKYYQNRQLKEIAVKPMDELENEKWMPGEEVKPKMHAKNNQQIEEPHGQSIISHENSIQAPSGHNVHDFANDGEQLPALHDEDQAQDQVRMFVAPNGEQTIVPFNELQPQSIRIKKSSVSGKSNVSEQVSRQSQRPFKNE